MGSEKDERPAMYPSHAIDGEAGRRSRSRPHWDDLHRNYPELEPEDVRQALVYAAANLEDGAIDTMAV